MNIDQLLDYRKQCQEIIERKQMLNRLQNNSDFQHLFLEYFAKTYATSLVHLLGDPSIYMTKDSDVQTKPIYQHMIGIATFMEFMRNIESQATQAQKTLDDINQSEREEMQS